MVNFLAKFMKKRVYIIHGWEANSKLHWFPWLKKELEKLNFEVIVPDMPDTNTPTIEKWVGHLNMIIDKPDENTYLIGHSIGCQTIIRYLEKSEDIKIGGAILVAGFFTLTNINTKKEKETAKPWLNTPIVFERVKKASKTIIAILSDDDPYVPLENSKLFKNNLKASVIIMKNAGHFNTEDGITELPIVLEKLLEISK